MNIVFAGTPEFAVPALTALSEKHNISAVFTQPDRRSGRGKKVTSSPVKLKAMELGIEIHQPKSLKNQTELIQALNPDVMVVVAYGMLLSQDILDIPRYGCINIHASILPRWRGAAPIHRSLQAGDSETGVSIMAMELGLDTGPVYQVLKTPIVDSDTTATLHDRLSILGAQGIVETLRVIEFDPSHRPVTQDDSKATYAKKLSKVEGVIDWTLEAADINRQVRAFIPFPVAYTHYQGTRIRILETRVETTEDHEPGKIIDILEDGPLVACGSNAVVLKVLQRDGSRAMKWKDFKNGYPLKVGDKLGSQDG